MALHAAWGLVPASWKRIGSGEPSSVRWVVYAVSVVLPRPRSALSGAGARRLRRDRDRDPPAGRPSSPGSTRAFIPAVVLHGAAVGGLGALAWVALKVGALSYGGGFVIIPLMQHDAVTTYHWMTGAQFLNAVALGQVTPGPVVQTVAVVGYAAGGVGGGLLAALIAFAPSFVFVLVGGRHFDQIRANTLGRVVPHRGGTRRHRRHRRIGHSARALFPAPLADPGAGRAVALALPSRQRRGGRIARRRSESGSSLPSRGAGLTGRVAC